MDDTEAPKPGSDGTPPMNGRRSIHDLLEAARRRLSRLTPVEAHAAASEGAVVIDTRSSDERREQGVIPGSRHHPLSILEWTLDPASDHAEDGIRLDSWLILLCAEGYSSSLAATRLHAIGFTRATDMIGGFTAWKGAGLPVEPPPA